MKKLLTLCCAVLIGSCCAAAFIYANQASLSPQANLIDSALRSNSNEFKQSAQAVSLPDDWVKTSLSSTVQWYRIRIPDSVKQLPLVGVFIPSLEMTPALYLNGRFVGGNEKLSDPLPRYWNRPVYTMLPANSLAADDNYLDIRIAANGQWGRLSAVQIGPHQQLSQAYERLFFMRVTLARFVQFFCLLMAAFLLPLFFMRREAVFAAFSAFALSWFASNFLVTHLQFSVSNRILDWAIYSSAGLLLASYSFFTLRVLYRRWPRWERCLIAIAGVGMVILYITSHFDIRSFNDLGSKIWIASLVLLAVAPFLIVVRDVFSQPPCTPPRLMDSTAFLNVQLSPSSSCVSTTIVAAFAGIMLKH